MGVLPDGRVVHKFRICDPDGYKIELLDLGATLYSVRAPDRSGRSEELLQRCESLGAILSDTNYFGATVGRYASRIAEGRLCIDGVEHRLPLNGGKHHTHGGVVGFNRKLWSGSLRRTPSGGALAEFHCESPAGEEGYPGRVEASVSYEWTPSHDLVLRFRASTSEATVVNLVNHAYWNLSGGLREKIDSHVWRSASLYPQLLRLSCPSFAPFEDGVPRGEVRSVSGSPLDFTRATRLGDRLPQISSDGKCGIDHCFFFEAQGTHEAVLEHPESGRRLELTSNMPSLIVYTGNWMEGAAPFDAVVSLRHRAICLEDQFPTNSPNCPSFPSPVLRPGEEYLHETKLHFSVVAER